MLAKTPSTEELKTLVGEDLFNTRLQLQALISSLYDMPPVWNSGGRASFSFGTMACYDAAMTYHDGKWIMFFPVDMSLADDIQFPIVVFRPKLLLEQIRVLDHLLQTATRQYPRPIRSIHPTDTGGSART